jgi:hypothetical protein
MNTWQEELNELRLEKGSGWYGCIAPDGWKELVLKVDEMLSFIDPDYKINQIKSKYGTLRYYFSTTKEEGSIESQIMYAIESWAERRSSLICEFCGMSGELRDNRYWLATLCDKCEKKKEHE